MVAPCLARQALISA
jgi:hypothetical protein